MFVVATAGHVDHGKSTLVRALTGMEPDRWAEERRRGLTIDLGFAWTRLASGRDVAFVDVPGHERFLGNMLAGLGPAPAVCFVVAADEGWQAQSSDHRDAIAALGISHGIVVLTRSDRAPGGTDEVLARVRAELDGTGLRDAPAVTVSAVDGSGLDELRNALDDMVASLPEPEPDARVRLWIDRSFSISGAGTVVTGTLTAGTLTEGNRLLLVRHNDAGQVSVRALHSCNLAVGSVGPTSRVAVNFRSGPSADAIHRGDVLITGDSWPVVDTVDVRRTMGASFTDVPTQLLVHIGTAAVPCRMRPLGAGHARLTLGRRVPLELGDRMVLRAAGSRSVLAGAQILDVEPPALGRRGDSRRRADVLAAMSPNGNGLTEVARRGAVRVEQLRRMGVSGLARVPDGVKAFGEWWVHAPVFDTWARRLRSAVEQLVEKDPLAAGLSRGAAQDLLGPAGSALLEAVVREAGLTYRAGFVNLPRPPQNLGAAEAGIRVLENRLKIAPFAAAEAHELKDLGLGTRELAAAERSGRLLRLDDGVVLLPGAPALAMREIAALPQPFTTSEARKALGTTRRVVIPLLEYLDGRGWTRRLDATRRTVT
ncbi:selenocysteine-specific translation elongation factor [Arthrobacter crystallopoietes BAB-32]|uniref:Selenocysteine-specific translation elongation factor n=1 Tax=Arthrobacter crystallopoietes BAB-32 TaxID=1246476 RepID=N1V648_9MICC|nr:selenocysteine-specific translation elongation factor [Arthrobacter crystallopoietes]EMY35494.1 selenocysteine-specific translation elongation factor [Arthrobacter crystallopoietes BAB-32]